MDIGNLIKNINSLNEYVAATQDASEKCKTSRIQLNMSTVIALKKIRSLEIEHVNKCEENGIACVIFERMLCLPPSKTWGVLSKEMVTLLQYWLDAVRKHLVKHSTHWWTFLKLLLKFIKEIRLKDSSVPNILVEYTSECLLDLATTERPDAMQRYEILHCFNMYCSESSREIRFALRTQFGQYFTKLANYMSSCGNLATQYSIMETLLRWLLPRQDRTLRITSATKWFPARLYADNTVDIFLERPWINFFQDARDLLNSHNERSDLITSVVCRKVSVGDIVIISDSEKMDSWLDINCSSKCISVLLDPRVLDVFGCTNHKAFETFVVSQDNTQLAKLCRESDQMILSVQTITPPCVLPSCMKLGDDVSCHVTVVVTSRCDVKRLDAALRKIFDDKYQLLLDLEQEIPLSPLKVKEYSKDKTNKSEQDPRFSHPAEVRRRVGHSGYMVRSRAPLSCMSPSTASTSSLTLLHEKLAALPKYNFDKEPESVCALPDLSVVSETSEFDERSTKTLNFETYGNCNKNQSTLDFNRKSQSDNETSRRYPETSRKGKFRQLSPIIKEDSPSCLLIATVGSADESVINETVEKLSNCKDFNPDSIVDLLVQEALQANLEKYKDKIDSGINTGEKKSEDVSDNCDAIENTPYDVINLNKTDVRCTKVVSSTSDESNTEAINDTPDDYVNTSCRNRKGRAKADAVERQSFDVHAVEEFFSQHFTANGGDTVISPSLAKKNNETSSEISEEHLEDNFNFGGDDLQGVELCDFNNIEVLECLNSIVDKVCDDFDKCTKYLNKEQDAATVDSSSDFEDNLPLKDILNKIQSITPKATTKKSTSNKIKLKFKVASKKDKPKSRAVKRKNKLEIETVSKMSTIIEDKAETVHKSNLPEELAENLERPKESVPDNECTTPLLRRKRKLFSPKDELMSEKTRVEVETHSHPEDNDKIDANKTKTPKSTVPYKPYKEIEKERERYIRMPRNRKSKKTDTPSPRSKKINDLFDKVKESVNEEPVTLAKPDLEIYNFSTDSEDDFKEKNTRISRKPSNTTLDSVESTVLRRGRVIKRVSSANKNKDKNTKRKVNSRQKVKKEIIKEPVNDLIDERMREHKEVLDSSIVVETPNILVTEPELVLKKPPEMEVIDINDGISNEIQKTRRTRKNKAKGLHNAKGVKKILNNKPNVNEDRTESPLPGLVVEEAPSANKEDADFSANMVDKFKKICQNPEKYINESNTTQNLLSDNEVIIYSPQNVDITGRVTRGGLQIKNENRKLAKSKKASSVKDKNTKLKKEVKASNKLGSETKSDNSIATDGITGHGDSEEAPPSPKLIGERLEHRNLHTEYLDRSTKEYFDKLTEDINDINEICRNDSNDNDISRTLNKSDRQNDIKVLDKKSTDSTKSLKSAVISIERLSLEDISRWLPSRRNSETEYSQSSNKSKQKSNDAVKINDSPKSKHVHSEDDNDDAIQEAVRRYLILKNNKSSVNKNNDSNKNSPNKNNESNSSVKSTQITVKAKKIPTKRVQPSRQVKCTLQSVISPIKSLGDLISNADKLSETTLSDDEQYMSVIKETISKRKTKRTSKEEESRINKKIKKELSNKTVLECSVKSLSTQSSHSKISTSTKIEHSRTLKRISEEDRDGRKKNKVEDNNNIGDVVYSGSGVTLSSVDDWFKRGAPSGSKAEEIDISIRDSIHNVMEKLDTTLIEIHQNTSNKFVHLFVNAQQQLSELKQERQNMYKQAASDLLNGLYRLLDAQFAELDKKSMEQDTQFMNQLKEQASAVIRDDCKKKRVMVQLLKEDVQAVLQHVANRTQ